MADQSILIVDSDRTSASALRNALTESGVESTIVGNAFEAARQCVTRPPAAILLSLDLPGAGGLDALKLIRKNVGPQAPLVFAMGGAAVGIEAIADEVARHELVGHLGKPLDLEAASAAIRLALTDGPSAGPLLVAAVARAASAPPSPVEVRAEAESPPAAVARGAPEPPAAATTGAPAPPAAPAAAGAPPDRYGEVLRAARAAAASGNMERACDLLGELLEAWPNRGEAYALFGAYAYQRSAMALADRRPLALEHLERALHLAPQLPEPHYLRGWVADQERDVGRARAEYEAALKLEPGYAPARKALEAHKPAKAGAPAAPAVRTAAAAYGARPSGRGRGLYVAGGLALVLGLGALLALRSALPSSQALPSYTPQELQGLTVTSVRRAGNALAVVAGESWEGLRPEARKAALAALLGKALPRGAVRVELTYRGHLVGVADRTQLEPELLP